MMQNTSSSPAEEVVGNTDILWEILRRVQLKYLLRLKLVSKRWLKIISHQRFREFHSLHHHPRPTSLIFSDGYGSSHILSFTTTTPPTLGVLNLDFLNQTEVKVIRSCNGFLLCKSRYAYFVCNPITRDFTVFNLHNHPFKNKSIELYLAFDPSISPHYKVISLAHRSRKYAFNEYSFKTRSWIRPGVSYPAKYFGSLLATDGVYCNRAIHWCTYSMLSVYVNVDTLRLKCWPMPITSYLVVVSKPIMYFGESGGNLYLVYHVRKNSKIYDIFEVKEDYSEWTLRHRINLKPLLRMYRGYYSTWGFTIVRPIIREEKSMMVLLASEETLILFDPITSSKLGEFKITDNIRYSLSIRNVFYYFENNTLVKACTDVDDDRAADSTPQQLNCCPIL